MARVFTSSVIHAPVDRVWNQIRDFNGLPGWHPAIADSRIEDGGSSDRVGCIRNFNLVEGGNIREQLLALSDTDHLQTYSILESPMPLTHYIATLRLLPVTDGNVTYAEWTAEFDCADVDRDGLVDLVGNGVFGGGLAALNTKLSA